MKLKTFNADLVRAALQTAEKRVAETLKDLESNDIDNGAVTARIREIEKNLRRMARAA